MSVFKFYEIFAYFRSPTGKQFLRDEIQRLRKQLIEGSASADVHAALGSFLEKQGDITEAIYHLEMAVKEASEGKLLFRNITIFINNLCRY